MATRPIPAAAPEGDQSLSISGRYQLTVIAADMADAVRLTGGWLYDRARAGWVVSVRVADTVDLRPLTILGAGAVQGDIESILATVSRSGALAVSAALLADDADLRDRVISISAAGLTEVSVWGDVEPVDLGHDIESMKYHMSAAARAFKTHALAAAAVNADSVDPTESLFRIGARAGRALRSV